ncbi:unnamed protein product [Orchesella dallaii]|uniref:Uncharacterized protein n=1 Tax=Orchesella dallaii TaxID=48710 RepID=A0ABP1QT87_9HEXA
MSIKLYFLFLLNLEVMCGPFLTNVYNLGEEDKKQLMSCISVSLCTIHTFKLVLNCVLDVECLYAAFTLLYSPVVLLPCSSLLYLFFTDLDYSFTTRHMRNKLNQLVSGNTQHTQQQE